MLVQTAVILASPWDGVTIASAAIAAFGLAVAVAGFTVCTRRLEWLKFRWKHTWDDQGDEAWVLELKTESVRFTLENRRRDIAHLQFRTVLGGSRERQFPRATAVTTDHAVASMFTKLLMLLGSGGSCMEAPVTLL